MQNLILRLGYKDWLLLCGIGFFFSITLSLLSYFLADVSLLEGLYFGILLGFCLCLCAVFTIVGLNTFLLPRIALKHWISLSSLCSFLSGFIGTLLGSFLANLLHVKMLPKLEIHFILFAFFIGAMSYVVARLLYTFIALTNAKREDEKRLIQSRLGSLEAQLNPHFLFNALNSLAELLHTDILKAERSLLYLSHFMRSTMKESAMIELREEMENIKGYIAIENIRFSDKIILFETIPENSLALKVPKFSIQLIVENAIKHGFNHQALSIDVSVGKTYPLKIIISNDGIPLKDSKLGIGLCNLKERLALLCDGELEIINTHKPTFELTIKEKV